ncbi:hypothetical protein J5N97_027726 [Dioscorea zingiberensis]|uniref:Protein kinase domain-containing protein n=1 Tax=Dioscorea zingiberensis TaxID=325984 RepID=A0A9D5BXR9_9LILI|nr:hypothetical protein J5N97_027726 [Dioscorea zingiberensis]
MNWGSWNRGPTIGRGATATVSLAAVPASDLLFAVKSMELNGSAPLQREKEILSGLDSPHVVSYLGFDVTSAGGRECYNLFMEYAPGGSLAEEIKRHGGKLDEIGIRARAREILLGLAYLHANRVAHCDIKGENIVIGADGKAKIADLGCAKELGDYSDRRIRGTPAFMAPEVARGEAQGPEADIWALGCTVIQMATGKAPWLDSDPLAVLHRIAFSGESPPLPPSLSDDARDFLSRCLMKIPSERWSADELLIHPFLSSSSETHWISPKSTLDKDVWDSLTDDDEEEEEEEEESPASDPLESPAERLGVLFTEDFSGSPNWTWDENWMPVRSFEIIEEEEELELMVSRLWYLKHGELK